VDNMWITLRYRVCNSVDNATYLTCLLPCCAARKPLWRGSLRKWHRVWPVLCLIAGLLVLTTEPVEAATDSDHYKLYAHSRIISDKQYKCLSSIIYKESRWNPNARNHSHYGLGQMRSLYYKNLDPYRQIDKTIEYIKLRYGSMCNAWLFHQKRNYY
jgi:hypothetical protein